MIASRTLPVPAGLVASENAKIGPEQA